MRLFEIGDIVEVDNERYELSKSIYRGVICKVEVTPYGKQLHIRVSPKLITTPARVQGNKFIVHESVVQLVKLE